MPKISAPTVAEHRAAQHAALISAAEEILVESGAAAVTPRSIGERAGLARSSVYEYFRSSGDILIAVASAAFDRWNDEIAHALADAPAHRQLELYVRQTMRMTADGRHGIATTMQHAELSTANAADLAALHQKLLHPIAAVLAAAGAPGDPITGTLFYGLLDAGMQLVGHGTDADEVSDRVLDLVRTGLLGPRDRGGDADSDPGV